MVKFTSFDIQIKKRTGARCEVTAVGFEPTPLRTGALNQRLRPLGRSVLIIFGAVAFVCHQFSKQVVTHSVCLPQGHATLKSAGFEATHPKLVGLESTALDHSAKVSRISFDDLAISTNQAAVASMQSKLIAHKA